ncbi:phage portal protein [bacterium]|nr:phage portal protein [bacterium]
MIKQWFSKLLSPPTVKNSPLPVNVVGDRAVVQMFPSFSNLIKEAYTKNSIVLACITRLALDFPEPKIIIRSKIDNAIISNHPIHTLLNRPNPLMSLYELMSYIMTYLAIGGNAYIHLRRNRAGKIIELWPYHAGDIKPVLSQAGQSWLSHYEHTSSGRITIVPIEDIVHFKWVLPDLQQPVVAQPPLLAVASEVDSSNFLTLYLLKLLQNDATPRTVLTVPEGTLITDKSRSRLLDNFVQAYGGGKYRKTTGAGAWCRCKAYRVVIGRVSGRKPPLSD